MNFTLNDRNLNFELDNSDLDFTLNLDDLNFILNTTVTQQTGNCLRYTYETCVFYTDNTVVEYATS